MVTTLMDEPGNPGNGKPGTSIWEPREGTRLITGDAVGEEGAKAADSAVVGWLVVIDGPGKGNSIELGFGMNIIGRGRSNRIALSFGDDRISEEDHFRIAYDVKNRKFHLVPGRGTNLVYISDEPLLAPQVLNSGSNFKVGLTLLRFVALCGPDWDWEMTEQASA